MSRKCCEPGGAAVARSTSAERSALCGTMLKYLSLSALFPAAVAALVLGAASGRSSELGRFRGGRRHGAGAAGALRAAPWGSGRAFSSCRSPGSWRRSTARCRTSSRATRSSTGRSTHCSSPCRASRRRARQILRDVEAVDQSLLMWRQFTQLARWDGDHRARARRAAAPASRRPAAARVGDARAGDGE